MQTLTSPATYRLHVTALLSRNTDLLDALSEAAKLGDYVRIRLPMRTVYFINHPDGIKHVLVDNNRNYHKGRGLRMAQEIIGQGLLTSEDDLHKRQRRMIQPAFHRRRIASYADVMTTYTQEHLDTWWEGQQCDLHEEMMSLTMAIVAKCLFDVDVRYEAAEIGAALEGVFDNITLMDSSPIGVALNKLPLPRKRRRGAHRQVLDRAIQGFIEQRRHDHAERDDLLSMLLGATDDEGDQSGMSDQQIRDEVMTLFLAGHETTANALSWALYLLMQHPAIEEKLVDEVKAVLGSRPPTMADLPALKYNKMVFSEAMRLYPPAYVVGRQALADDEVDGFRIPAGAMVVMSQYVMHRHPRYWDDPQQFKPERFAEDAPQPPRYAYFPFGGGPRLCIGEPFAWMEGELLLAAIIQQYHFTLQPGAVIQPMPLITLRLRHGLPVTIRERWTTTDSGSGDSCY